MAVIGELSPETLAHERLEKKVSAINALVELVDGASPDEQPHVISDKPAWVHTAFYTYRSGMADNDPDLAGLPRIEHDFIAALVALNFDDQQRQLRQALLGILAFPKARG